MDSVELAKVGSLESGQTVDPDALIGSNHDDLTVVLGELEAADDGSNIDLVLQNDRVSAVDHDVVAIFTHDGKHGLDNDGLFLDRKTILTHLLLILLARVLLATHLVQVLQVDVPVENVLLATNDRHRESDVHVCGGEL